MLLAKLYVKWHGATANLCLCQDVVLTHSLSTAVRWQAVLYFKNGIDRYWRKMAPK